MPHRTERAGTEAKGLACLFPLDPDKFDTVRLIDSLLGNDQIRKGPAENGAGFLERILVLLAG